MEQMIKFIPGQNGNPGQFMSPLPIKPFNISSVKENRATADEQNRQMVLRLQKDPEALEQVERKNEETARPWVYQEAQGSTKKHSGRTKERFQAFYPNYNCV